MSDYRWSFAGLPFMPEGVVLKGDRVILRLEYENQDEQLLVYRLSEIVRALERTDKKRSKQP